MIISISGIDGCGKTSIIDGVRRGLEAEGRATRYVWLRYNHYLTKVLLVFCRLIGLTRYEYPDGVRVGYHDFYRSRVVSWLFIVFTFIDTLLVSILLVYLPSLLTSRVIVCDRWIPDIMIDLEIDTRVRFTSGGWLEKVFRSLVPSGARCFLIMREQQPVLQCRPENSRDGNFAGRWALYRDYASRPWISVVENDRAVDDAVAVILDQARVKGEG